MDNLHWNLTFEIHLPYGEVASFFFGDSGDGEAMIETELRKNLQHLVHHSRSRHQLVSLEGSLIPKTLAAAVHPAVLTAACGVV